jgi:hypothetical protein
MNDDEPNAPQSSQYANTAEVKESERALLPGITGREDNLGADPASPAAVDIDQPIGAQPRSTMTGQQSATGEDETIDGLSESEEALRAAAEDETEADDFEETPVFDRAETIPKII